MARKARTAPMARAPRVAAHAPRPKRQASVHMPRPKTAVSHSTSGASETTTRNRRGKAPGGEKVVQRAHTVNTATGARSTTRKAVEKTKGGLTRTAKVATHTDAAGDKVSTRTITREKNGRKVVRKVTRTRNADGTTSVKRSAPKVTGKGPKSTKFKKGGGRSTHTNTATGTPRKRAAAKPRRAKATTTPKIHKRRKGRVKLK